MTEFDEHSTLSGDKTLSVSKTSKPKIIFFGAAAVFLLLVGWRLVAVSRNDVVPKSKSERDLEAVKKKAAEETKKAVGADRGESLNGNSGTDQPTGDTKSLELLQEARLKEEKRLARLKDVEDAGFAQAQFTQYSRMLQRLPYDATLAAGWQARVTEFAKQGKGVPPTPQPLDADSTELLKKVNPQLYSQITNPNDPRVIQTPGAAGSILVGGAPQGQPGAPNLVYAGTSGAGPNGTVVAQGQPGVQGGQAKSHPAGIPANIDPKTGLPLEAMQGESIYAVGSDGMPDIEGGAIPLQFTFVPPGQTNPQTVTRWVRPSFLTGRAVPYDPRELIAEDQAYRTNLKAPTDIPDDKDAKAIMIPWSAPQNKARVNSDFTAKNHYVVVVRNPNGQLSPPNPKRQPSPSQEPTP